MSTTYVRHGSLSVAAELEAFVRDEAAPGTGVTPDAFWAGFEALLAEHAPTYPTLPLVDLAAGRDAALAAYRHTGSV